MRASLGQPSLGHPRIAAQILSSARAVPPAQAVDSDLLATIRKKSLVGVFVLTGLFALGLWVVSFGPQGVRPRAAEPLPSAAEVTAVKTAASPSATPATPTAKAATSEVVLSTPHKKEPPKPKSTPPRRAPAPPPTAARATLPEVIPVSKPSPIVAPATLEIEVDHKFAEANLSIWVDGTLTYTHSLEGTDKKRLGVFHHVQGHEIHSMQISPGKHSLRVQVTSDSASYDQFATLAGEFTSGAENVLHINCNKHGDINLTLQ